MNTNCDYNCRYVLYKTVLNNHIFYIHFVYAMIFKKIHVNQFKFDIFAKIGKPATFASSFRNGLSSRWVLVNYPILARTQIAFKNEYRVGRVLNVKRRVITRLVNQSKMTTLGLCPSKFQLEKQLKIPSEPSKQHWNSSRISIRIPVRKAAGLT